MNTNDATVTWQPSPSAGVTSYQVTWVCGAINKAVNHPVTDSSATFVKDTGYAPIHGNVISVSVAAVDALGQPSTRVNSTPPTVTIPTPQPPDPPSNVVLVVGA